MRIGIRNEKAGRSFIVDSIGSVSLGRAMLTLLKEIAVQAPNTPVTLVAASVGFFADESESILLELAPESSPPRLSAKEA